MAAAIAAAICVRLGFWQLDRHEQRAERNAAILGALALPPLRLTSDSLRVVASDPQAFAFRRVRLSGIYPEGRRSLLRGRARQGSPGVVVVAPLQLSPGASVLVQEGWLPAPDAATADPTPTAVAGPVDVVGVIQPVGREGEPLPATVVVRGDSIPTYQRFTRAAIVRGYPEAIPTFTVQRTEGGTEPAASRPLPLELPELSGGPHLGYAVQWFGFAAVIVIGTILLIRKSLRDVP